MSLSSLYPVATIGLGSLLLRSPRGFFTQGGTQPSTSLFIPQVAIEEIHMDELMVTDHPVESGSAISDHAYKLPVHVRLHWAWSDSPAVNQGLLSAAMSFASGSVGNALGLVSAGVQTVNAFSSLLSGNSTSQIKSIYQNLIALQNSRMLFSIVTGKRSYKNMLMKSIQVLTDRHFDNALVVQMECREIQIAYTQTVQITSQINSDPTALSDPAKQVPINSGQVQLSPTSAYVPVP